MKTAFRCGLNVSGLLLVVYTEADLLWSVAVFFSFGIFATGELGSKNPANAYCKYYWYILVDGRQFKIQKVIILDNLVFPANQNFLYVVNFA